MPPLIIAAGITAAGALGGGAMSIIGANNAAGAADRNTQATIGAAKERQEREIAERQRIETAALGFAQKSPEEIQAFSSLLKSKEFTLSENKRLIDSQMQMLAKFDPAIQEAGDQMLKLLKGESSRYLAPVTQQREIQRAKLEGNLARTMGAGWRTSSAGIEAITRFDQQTFEATSSIQANALNQVASLYSGGVNLKNATIGSVQDLFKTNIGVDQAVLASEDAVKRRQIAAQTGAAQVAPINFGAVQDASKTVGQGDAIRGNALSGLGNSIAGVGASIGGQLFGNELTNQRLESIFGKSGGGSSLNFPSLSAPDVSGGSFGQTYPSLLG